MLGVYRIISYLLMFVAFFMSMGIFTILGPAFSNPALLLPVFIAGGVVLYSVSSFQFLQKGIRGGRKMKPSRKDFIKVNAYVSLAFALLNIFQTFTLIADPAVLKEVMRQLETMPKNEIPFSTDQLYTLIKVILWLLLGYAIALIVHVQITFRLLKIYAGVFDASQEP